MAAALYAADHAYSTGMIATTVLLRHAHPKFMAGDQITSQVFMPFPKDEGLLSVDDGDQVTAAESHEHYTGALGLESDSVWAVTKAEADGENVPASADPVEGWPAHSKIDFTGKADKDCRKIAKRLKRHALNRGCHFRPA